MQQSSRTVRSALAVIATTVLLIVAACSSSDSTSTVGGGGDGAGLPDCPVDALDGVSSPVEIVLWNSYVAKPKEAIDKLVAEYNASQDKVRVRAESQGSSYDELWSKYLQAAPTGGLPNAVIVEDSSTQAMADSGTVLPAQSCIDADHYDTSDLVQSAVDYYSIDGAFYPATVNLSSPLLYINKNHLRRAGLDPNTAPATLDELRDVAQKIKDAGVASTPLVMNLSGWFVETWLTGDGEPIVDNDNGRGTGTTTAAAFDDEATTDVLQWIKDMYDDGLMQAIPLVPGKFDHLFALQDQNSSMTFESSTAATSIQAFLAGDTSVASAVGAETSGDTSGLDIGAAKMPGLTEAGQVQIGGAAWYMTNSGTPQQQAATWDFMKWWNRPETQIQWHTLGSYIPFSQKAAQSEEVRQFWNDSLAGQWLALSYQQLSRGVDPNWPGPLIGPYQDVRKSIEAAMDAVTIEKKDVASSLSSAAATSTKAIEDYNEGNF